METFQKRLNKSSQRIATCSALQKPPGAAALAKGARKEWSRDAKVLLPGMLDKLKDKTSAVIVALQSALDESIKYCFELGEAVDEACVALSHKVPKVQVETLKWLAKTFEGMNRASISALHKSIVPPIVKCTSRRIQTRETVPRELPRVRKPAAV